MRISIFLIGFLYCACVSLEAAPAYPEVGKICPDFMLNNIEYFRKTSAGRDDFKGKWLILECWNVYSGQDGYWEKHLSDINAIQNSYRDNVQVILIGYTGSQYAMGRGPTMENMKMSYEYERSLQKVNLPISYDSSFFHKFDISACPYIIVIDPKGYVRAVCSSLTKKDVASFLKNQHPVLPRAFRTHETGSSYYYYNTRTYPEIGLPYPGYIFNNVEDYTSRELNSKALRGKWLVIDCWHRWCSSCIQSFPKTDSLQKEFKNTVQFLLVGYNGTAVQKYGSDDSAIRALYKNLQVRNRLSLAHTFDSVFFKQNDIMGCPFIIVIDPEGIVRGITYKLTYHNLLDLIEGRNPGLPRAYRKHDKENPEYGLDPFIENAGR